MRIASLNIRVWVVRLLTNLQPSFYILLLFFGYIYYRLESPYVADYMLHFHIHWFLGSRDVLGREE